MSARKSLSAFALVCARFSSKVLSVVTFVFLFLFIVF
jgi:hypothetical protein